ncbi:MAG: hypothetical protein B6I38_05705 [Anaerolineaceae bacterium 4572_5.1]|nr:MAG: hypothetical protein B6I38_05705 [Anaerolineaceae bacterium 4572_5.1]
MPIYTYRCENCGVQFDRRQKFSDDPLTICPWGVFLLRIC